MTTWLNRMFTSIQSVLSHEVWPFVEGLFSTIALDTIQALAPIAEKAVADIGAELPLLLTQGTEGFLKAFNATVATTVQGAEAAGIQAASSDLITAAHAALVNAQAALPKPAP